MDKMTIERDSEMLEVGNTFGWISQSSKEGPFPILSPMDVISVVIYINISREGLLVWSLNEFLRMRFEEPRPLGNLLVAGGGK